MDGIRVDLNMEFIPEFGLEDVLDALEGLVRHHGVLVALEDTDGCGSDVLHVGFDEEGRVEGDGDVDFGGGVVVG